MTWDKRKTAAAVLIAGLSTAGAVGYSHGWFVRSSPAHSLVFSGNIEAHESVLSFKNVQSRIVELPFDEGQWLKQGTLIARVDDSDYQQQVAMAQANVAVQERQLDTTLMSLEATHKTLLSDQADLAYKTLDSGRIREMATQGYESTDAKDLAEAALKESQAALERDRALEQAAARNIELARATIKNAEESSKLSQIEESYTTLLAPFDGVILVRQAELGEVVSPGMPIVTLADIDHVWLRAYVNEPDIGRIRLGQAAVVSTDNYPGKRYRGRISFIAEKAEFTPKSVETHAERVTLVYRIRVDVENPSHELVPGMPADAELQLLPAAGP